MKTYEPTPARTALSMLLEIVTQQPLEECDRCHRKVLPSALRTVHASDWPSHLRDARLGHYASCRGGCQ